MKVQLPEVIALPLQCGARMSVCDIRTYRQLILYYCAVLDSRITLLVQLADPCSIVLEEPPSVHPNRYGFSPITYFCLLSACSPARSVVHRVSLWYPVSQNPLSSHVNELPGACSRYFFQGYCFFGSHLVPLVIYTLFLRARLLCARIQSLE